MAVEIECRLNVDFQSIRGVYRASLSRYVHSTLKVRASNFQGKSDVSFMSICHVLSLVRVKSH